ncbi:MAG: geranylgeranylglycerol-phosphate geranylgeranyltransferase [Natronomonas sp.]|jgi:geranylgeranylglycerol-phosphate geranylgeranyltransferase
MHFDLNPVVSTAGDPGGFYPPTGTPDRMEVSERVRGLVELTRLGNAVGAGVLTFIGAFVAIGLPAGPDRVHVGVAIGATVIATGAGNAINDYFDREIDAINAPDRPIPRGAVTPRSALAFSVVLFGGAIGLALTLPSLAILIAVINLAALVTYTEVFKGLPGAGNVVVGYLGGSTFLFGAASVERLSTTAIVLFLLAAVSTVTREIIKDVEDIEGDREEGLRTLPIAIGERRALAIGGALLVAAVVASPLPWILGTLGVAYLALVVPADGIMLYALAESFEDPTDGQKHIKIGMFLAAASFVVGRSLLLL